MDVIPDLIDLEIVAGDHKVWLVNEAGAYLPGAPAGTYQEDGGRFLIRIDRSNLAEPSGPSPTSWPMSGFSEKAAHRRSNSTTRS